MGLYEVRLSMSLLGFGMETMLTLSLREAAHSK